jgi:hypothetical protein
MLRTGGVWDPGGHGQGAGECGGVADAVRQRWRRRTGRRHRSQRRRRIGWPGGDS